jgi:hypothetical protein
VFEGKSMHSVSGKPSGWGIKNTAPFLLL